MSTLKKMFAVLLSMAMFFSVASTTVFALDTITIEPIEDSYIEIVNEVFPGYSSGAISPQWTSGDPDAPDPLTHGYITEVAYDLLRDDNSDAYTFYQGQLANLVRGSVLPDADETNGIYAWHFYGENGKNWQGGTVTAYTKCIEHYNDAVDLYEAGNKSAAMEELGRALHYLQDVNVPHHAMNKVAGLSNHTQFENEAEANRTSYVVTGLTNSIYTAADDSLGTIIDYYADIARGWYDEASSNQQSERATAAGASVRNSQRATVTVLYKFMQEVS